MQTFVLVVHIILAVLMIVLIFVQHGKVADTGAPFGVGFVCQRANHKCL